MKIIPFLTVCTLTCSLYAGEAPGSDELLKKELEAYKISGIRTPNLEIPTAESPNPALPSSPGISPSRNQNLTTPPLAKPRAEKPENFTAFDFNGTPLSEALGRISTLKGINIILDREGIRAQGGDPEIPITLRAQNMKLGSLLKWIMRLSNLDFTIENEAIFVTHKNNLKSAPVLRVYNVGDLVTPIRDFPGRKIDLNSINSQGNSSLFSETEQTPSSPVTGEELLRLIKSSIAKDSW